MKKIITLAITLFSFTVMFAQSRNDRNDRNDRYGNYSQSNDVWQRKDNNAYNAYNYQTQRSNDRYGEQRRREEMDRINRDYDRRINDYRNDRSVNVYERDRRIQQAENERRGKLKSFTGGAVVGVIAGVLLGTVLSH
jgi:hypothetical protein